MKVSLVVASGAHQGKVIPITGPQFLIGRDAQCHLRPASQAISKHHCGVLVRDGQVYVKDFGSTNGTTVNDDVIKGAEVGVADGASLKIGPLDFLVRIEKTAPIPDGTPFPVNTPEGAAALAAVQAAAGVSPRAPARDATPDPNRPARPDSKPGSKEVPALTGSKEAAALKAGAPAKPAGQVTAKATLTPPPGSATSEEDDKIAAMLLGMDEDGNHEVPEGSTVMDVPKVDALGNPQPAAAAPKVEEKKKAQTREEMSSAAQDLLRKMMRRPK
jgi:pSer/pThr/pTyr-binding forkhead associated (FHA) protein